MIKCSGESLFACRVNQKVRSSQEIQTLHYIIANPTYGDTWRSTLQFSSAGCCLPRTNVFCAKPVAAEVAS
jgi:hypothetical protein